MNLKPLFPYREFDPARDRNSLPILWIFAGLFLLPGLLIFGWAVAEGDWLFGLQMATAPILAGGFLANMALRIRQRIKDFDAGEKP